MDVWKLISEYSFVVHPDSRNDDLICIVCKKLLVDACESVCGCKYCYTCISEHLTNGNQYCLGSNRDCKKEHLIMDKNVMRNMLLNQRVSQLRVVCPNEWCQSKIELSQMNEHLRMCHKSSIDCPYTEIGCDGKSGHNESIFDHFQHNTFVHTHMLIEWIRNMKNEVDEMKNAILDSKLEIQAVREECKMKEIQIKDMIVIMNAQHEKESSIQEHKISELEQKLSVMEQRMNTNEKKMNGVNQNWKLKIETQLCDVNKEVDGMKIESRSIKEGIEKKMRNIIKWNQLCPSIDADFVWRINEFTKKVESLSGTPLFSEPFYAHGYRFCIRFYASGDNIGLRCYLMRGVNDVAVEWPMRLAVTINVIDQLTLGVYKNETFQYDSYSDSRAFGRSKNDMNDYGVGIFPFLLYSSIKYAQSVIVNDSVVVSCVFSTLGSSLLAEDSGCDNL